MWCNAWCISGLFVCFIHRKITEMLAWAVMAEHRNTTAVTDYKTFHHKTIHILHISLWNVHVHIVHNNFYNIYDTFLRYFFHELKVQFSCKYFLCNIFKTVLHFHLIFCLSVPFWTKLFPLPFRNWLSIQAWTMPSWQVETWHPWGAMESLPCTRCLTGPAPVDEGRALLICSINSICGVKYKPAVIPLANYI